MKHKKNYIALISLVAVGLVVGSIAYFSQDLSVENNLKTAAYNTQIEEEFIPNDEWLPGVETTKKVLVSNTGNVDVVVRVKMTDLWVRNADITNPVDGSILSEKGSILSNTFTNEEDGSIQDAAIKNFSTGMVFEYEDVKDNLANYTNKWIHYGDYYYYLGTIKGGEKSNPLLDSVTMNPLLDTVISGSHTVVEWNEEKGEVERTTIYKQGKYGYDSADYSLTIEATTVQATQSAINNIFGKDIMAKYLAENFATIKESI